MGTQGPARRGALQPEERKACRGGWSLLGAVSVARALRCSCPSAGRA